MRVVQSGHSEIPDLYGIRIILVERYPGLVQDTGREGLIVYLVLFIFK